jgi:replication factor C subunit 2/4
MSAPWVDKYRPKKLEHIIHQDEIKKVLQNTVKTGELPHLLLYGPPGTGKTSIILALGYELFGPQLMNERILELNASDERGIDTVREKIITFAKESINSVDPKYPCPPYKIIVLDEADAITLDAQSALRKVIETSSKITRFCFTCNYIDKIIDPIVSRCVKFRFKPIDKDSIVERLKFIAHRERIELDDKCYEKIYEISEGDARKAIMILQNTKYIFNMKKKINESDIIEMIGLSTNSELNLIWEEIKKSSKDNLMSNLIKITTDIHNFGINLNQFLIFLKDKIIESKLSDNNKSMIIMKIADTEARIIERGDEYINILNILCLIYCNFKKF